MDGGRLKWELSSPDVSFSVLVHEITHGFLMEKSDLLRSVVDATPGLTMTLMGEGIAYAVAPGMYEDGEGDNLRYNVAKDRKNREAWDDPSYGRQRMYGLGLRPLIREAFKEGEALEDFLPNARAVFLALQEIEEGPPGSSRPPGPPRLAVAGPANGLVRERLLDSKFRYWINRFNHHAETYSNILPQLAGGDMFVLLIAGDDSERIPDAHAWLSPMEPSEIERRLRKNERVSEIRNLESGLRVVLLAAPTTQELEDLVQGTPLLDV